MNKYDKFRELYPEFLYQGYCIEKKENNYKVTYNFSIKSLCNFNPIWIFPYSQEFNYEVFERLVFSLGMVELISYWKCACPKIVKIQCGSLSNEQLLWWKKLYYFGLGEFFFVNNILTDENEFMELICKEEETYPLNDLLEYTGCLVPVGGGKDSVVSLEILEYMKEDYATFSVNRTSATENVINKCSYKSNDIITQRFLSKELIELNNKGFLNGHTPFSAVIAFASVIAALLHKIKYIVLSNEASANESTIRNSFINHQYSKSYEFEVDFNWYLNTLTNSDIHYFSLLRPLTELQIAKIFSKSFKYHEVFRSCNSGSKQGIWCCNCAKCTFVYIILLPFLSNKELVEIFGENLLEKEDLELYFKELIGVNDNKPFECVGTREEVLAVLKDYIQKDGKSLLTEKYRDYILDNDYNIDKLLNSWSEDNNLPQYFSKALRRCIDK